MICFFDVRLFAEDTPPSSNLREKASWEQILSYRAGESRDTLSRLSRMQGQLFVSSHIEEKRVKNCDLIFIEDVPPLFLDERFYRYSIMEDSSLGIRTRYLSSVQR